MRKILFITGSLPPIRCGIGYYSNTLLPYLREHVDVSVVTTEGTNPLEGHQTYSLPDWKIRRIPALLRKARAERPDVIHIQYPAVGYRRNLGINLLPLCLRLFGPRAPIVVTLHEYHGSPLLGRIRNLVTTWFAHRILVSNPYDKAALPAPLKRKTSLVPIGSNISRVAASRKVFENIMAAAGLDASRPTIAFFGFAFPSKKLENLIAAMEQSPELQLLIMSELRPQDPYHAQLLEEASRINTQRKAIGITGFLDDETVSQVIQECRYFVQPQEIPLTAKSGTTITAVIHGLTIIGKAAPDPSLNEPYADRQNAALIPDVSAESIATALRKLEQSPDLRNQLQAGTRQLQQYFSWDEIVRLHLETYEQLSR